MAAPELSQLEGRGGDGAYRESIVVYLDVIGFSGLVQRSAADPGPVASLLTALEELRPLKDMELWPKNVRFYAFSDTVIYVASKTDGTEEAVEATWMLRCLHWAANAQLKLLEHGLMVRGGIAKGLVAEHGGRGMSIFGPALLEAHKLAEDKAQVSRVAIQDSLVPDSMRARWNTDRSSVVFQMNDGIWFLDYLRPPVPLVVAPAGREWLDFLRRLERHRKALLDYTEKADSTAELARCAWTLWYHNNTIRRVLPPTKGPDSDTVEDMRRRLKSLFVKELEFMAYATPPVELPPERQDRP